MQANYVLTYWPIKGATGELVRLFLHYLRLNFKEDHPDESDWFSFQKAELWEKGLDFPNLPFLTDGDTSLSESFAIPLYLAHKHGRPDLFGKGALDIAKHAEILGVMNDIRTEIIRASFERNDYVGKFTEMKKNGNSVASKIAFLSKFLGKREFFFGYFTFSDIVVAFFVYYLDVVFGKIGGESPFKKYKNLCGLRDSVFGLPGIRQYVQSPEWRDMGLMPPHLCPFMTHQ